jgi:hypothetical protein
MCTGRRTGGKGVSYTNSLKLTAEISQNQKRIEAIYLKTKKPIPQANSASKGTRKKRILLK